MAINKKNILFYIPTLSQDFGGVRQYAAGILKLLDSLTANFNFYIYHNGNDPVILEILEDCPKLILTKPEDLHISKFHRFRKKMQYYSATLRKKVFGTDIQILEKTSFDLVIERLNINIVHCPYQFIPKLSLLTSNRGVKLISTMHDVQELHFPEFFSPTQRASRAVNYMDYINRADQVIVSYGHIKTDLIKYFQKPADNITVLLMKMDYLWYKKFEEVTTLIPQEFDRYLFYPANFWQHKNHAKLIEAVSYLKANGIIVNLILTGDSQQDFGEKVFELIKNLNLENQIKILGIVDEEKLFSLYKNAVGVVIPTKYEAGSFPLMESILMEIPVICSNITSLPETIGNMDFTFDPNNVEEIAERIDSLWNDENFRKKSIENCKNQQARLKNTGAESILSSVYEKLMRNE